MRAIEPDRLLMTRSGHRSQHTMEWNPIRMPGQEKQMSRSNTARLAGLCYLILVVTGIFHLIYVPTQLIDWGDAAGTANNISNNELLFRGGVVVGILSYIAYLILPFILYRLFESVDRTQAVLMIVLAVVSVPVSLFSMVYKVDVLSVLSAAEYINAFSSEQIHAQVMSLLKSYNNTISVVQIFWGLWLFPFGYLVYKSGYLPRVLGVLLMLGCFGYLIRFSSYHLFPGVDIPGFVRLPGSVGEIGTCLWLLIMGAKDETDGDTAASTHERV